MDLSLDESQQILVDTFSEMLEKECPTTHVRDCEDTGFSTSLWAQYCELGANVMGLPESAGGLEMSLFDLGLVANQSGQALAPVPFLEIATVGRLLSSVAPEDPLLGAIAEGETAASISLPRPNAVGGTRTTSGGRTLVPFGTIADSVIALDGDTLYVAEGGDARRGGKLKNIGDFAIAHWDLDHTSNARVLATGDDAVKAMARANAEWKMLAGFWLTGIAQCALTIGSEYARERIQFGVPIGGFQAIAHPLAECAIRIDGGALVERIELIETQGDRTVLKMPQSQAGDALTAQERADLVP